MKKYVSVLLTLIFIISVVSPCAVSAPGNDAGALEGKIYLDGAPTAGIKLGITAEGKAAETAAGSVRVQWQIRNGIEGGFSDIAGASSPTYTPAAKDAGKFIRARFSADGYENELYSGAQMVVKQNNFRTPEPAKLTVSDGRLYIVGGSAEQEYVVTGTYYKDPALQMSGTEWDGAYRPTGAACEIDAEKDVTVYVYTRFRETDLCKAGAGVAVTKYYNGSSDTAADLLLTYKAPSGAAVGDVIELSVAPLPPGSDFDGVAGDGWLLSDAGYGDFYEDKECKRPLDPSVSYTKAYLGLKRAGNGVEVSVRSGSMSDTAALDVMREDFTYAPGRVTCDGLYVYSGDRIENYEISVYPLGGDLSEVTVSCDQPHAPAVSFDDAWDYLDVDATLALAGTYAYDFIYDGQSVGSLTVTVLSSGDTVSGDVNADKKINNKDVVALFRYVSGAADIEDAAAADINGDGKINNKDVVALFKLVSANG